MNNRNIISLGLALLIVFALSLSASAYSLMTAGYADPDIDYKSDSNVNSIYKYAMSYAMNSWNDASCDCTVSSSTGSANYLETYSTSTTTYGKYTPLALIDQSTHRATWFKISFNSNYWPSMSLNSRNSVAVHEIGHAMSLNDLSSGTAIMNNNRNRELIHDPQTDDINGVNASW